jgi:hypothetical protein
VWKLGFGEEKKKLGFGERFEFDFGFVFNLKI